MSSLVGSQCVACGQSLPTPRPSHGLVVCPACGHGDGTGAVVTGEVVNQDPGQAPGGRPNLLVREQLRLVRKLVRPGAQLIDVGCSNGTFLFHARAALPVAADSYGVEISAPNVATARAAGLRVEAQLAEVGTSAVVTFWQSAEHFPVEQLIDLLATIRARSDGTATALISVPNGASLQWRLAGRRWAYYDRTAHYSQFTPASLRAVLRRAGWADAAWHRSPVYGLFGTVQTSLNLLRPHNELYLALKRGTGELDGRAWVLNGLAGVVTSPVAALLAACELAPRGGAVLAVECRCA